MAIIDVSDILAPNEIYHGDSRQFLRKIESESIALSIWSPPYYVGKEYEKYLSFEDWKSLLYEVIKSILRTVFDSAVAARVLHFYSCVTRRNPRMEMPRATASQCTGDLTPNQETTT